MEGLYFEKSSPKKRLQTMLKVDFLRMFKTPLLYIILGISLCMPILILVMTTMFGSMPPPEGVNGAVTTAPMETFTNTWQAIGSYSDAGAGTSMDITTMCNINMLYFFIAVLVCLFVSEDFKSGYAKCLFAVRPRKTDYVISKTVVCVVGGALMLLSYFVGAMLGGAIASLPFTLGEAGVGGIVFCMLSKLLLVAVFVPIYLVMSALAKEKTWLSICLSFAVGMLLFMMIPALTPLDATAVNLLLCGLGGALFSVGLGAVSNLVLRKTALV